MINIKKIRKFKIREFLKENKNIIESLADLSNIFQSLAAVFTIVGIGFAIYQYQGQKQMTRQQKAFDLYEQFNDETFIKTRNDLHQAYYIIREKNLTDHISIEDYITIIKPIWKKQYIKIISVTNFFEQVYTCVERELCDKKATEALFGKEAKEFLEANHPFFCFERVEHGDKSRGVILEKFVKTTETTENINSQNSRNCNYIEQLQNQKILS